MVLLQSSTLQRAVRPFGQHQSLLAHAEEMPHAHALAHTCKRKCSTAPTGKVLGFSYMAALFAASRGRVRRRLTHVPRFSVGRPVVVGAVTDRPWFDQFVTSSIKAIESAEIQRVRLSSEVPSENNGGWTGEPREWANDTSLTQQISTISQIGPFAELKQFIAEQLAGDYDKQAVQQLVRNKIESNTMMMFSFSSCPFCLRAKTLLKEEYGVEPAVYECDLEPEGKAVRAELGRLTGRTSMPSTWLGPDVLLGGCNDGGLGGVVTLHKAGKLASMLTARGAVQSPPWWIALPFFGPDPIEVGRQKRNLMVLCQDAPSNGIGTPAGLKADIEVAASELQKSCTKEPARIPLVGTWDLVYCTAPGGSNGQVGPFIGRVSQIIVDDVRFANQVELFGTLKISLEAIREVVDDVSIKVTFKELAFSVFGFEVFRKTTQGTGVWRQRYVDKDLRVMNTPSLFVLRKRAD